MDGTNRGAQARERQGERIRKGDLSCSTPVCELKGWHRKYIRSEPAQIAKFVPAPIWLKTTKVNVKFAWEDERKYQAVHAANDSRESRGEKLQITPVLAPTGLHLHLLSDRSRIHPVNCQR